MLCLITQHITSHHWNIYVRTLVRTPGIMLITVFIIYDINLNIYFYYIYNGGFVALCGPTTPPL